jgi:hypothetical protein
VEGVGLGLLSGRWPAGRYDERRRRGCRRVSTWGFRP